MVESVAPAAPKDGSDAEKKAYKASRQAALEKHKEKIKGAEMLSMVLNTIGGGLGLVGVHAKAVNEGTGSSPDRPSTCRRRPRT